MIFLNQLISIYLQNQLSYLTNIKLKEINQLQNIIKLGELDYKSKSEKYIFSKYPLPIAFLKDI